MKKINFKYVSCFLLLLAGVVLKGSISSAAEVPVTEQNFPDRVFRNYISKEMDKDKNGVLSEAEILQTTRIVTKGDKRSEDNIVKNYQGIGYFTELEELRIEAVVRGEAEDDGGDYIDISLDVSGNPKLKRFSCVSSRVQKLDLSVCPLLEEISLQTGERPVQDLSKNQNLKKLSIHSNFSEIILPETLPMLEVLYWTSSKDVPFPAIDLRASENLTELGLIGFDFSNQELNLSRLVHLKSLHFCPWKKEGSVSVNLEGCSALEKLEIESTDKMNLQGCINLRELFLGGQMTEPDMASLINLEKLRCIGMTGKILDLRNNHHLKSVRILNCYYTEILLSEQASYQELTVDENNQLAKLDVRNIQVKDMNCNRNPNLRQLLLAKGKKYDSISARYNRLKDLDLRGVWVDDINCDNNRIKKLLLSKSGKYKKMSVKNNQLTKLDLRGIKLNSICADRNRITKLFLSKSGKYGELLLAYNRLKKLDLRGIKVKVMDCKCNKLHSLKVRGNKVLKELYCQKNQLKTLDMRKCRKLKILQSAGNKKLKRKR